MSYRLDPEIEKVLSGFPVPPPVARGDWKAMRTNTHAAMAALNDADTRRWPVSTEVLNIESFDGHALELTWFRKDASSCPGAVLYLHGGGMIAGSVPHYSKLLTFYAAATGVPILAPEYRLAPEAPHPAPFGDCLAALEWLVANAVGQGIDPKSIAVMGDSAGGGLAAAVAIAARDKGIPLSRQILIYPMLDDRNTTPQPGIAPFATWDWDANWTGWASLLGDAQGSDTAPEHGAPARARDLTGVAPMYVEVGDLDIFRNENLAFALRAADAGIPLEFHVHPGAPHGFDRFATDAAVTVRAMEDRYRVMQEACGG